MTDDVRNVPWPRAVRTAATTPPRHRKPGGPRSGGVPALLSPVEDPGPGGSGRPRRTVLLVGEPDDVAALHDHATAHPDPRYRTIGCCLPSVAVGRATRGGPPPLGCWDDVADAVIRFGIDAVVLAPSRGMTGDCVGRIVGDAGLAGAEVLLTSAVPALRRSRVRLRRVWGLPLLRPVPSTRLGRRTKAVADRLAAVVLLAVLLPVLLTAAVSVRAGSPGPVLIREPRVGRHGSVFELRRFRTTTPGGGPTTWGRLLHRWGLDELPQLLNVARGEMALVGPRPRPPAQLEQAGPEVRRALLVRPGLTGLWLLDADIRYVDAWSLRLDLRILARSAGAALRSVGRAES